MTQKRTGVYPGTFDPITNGHLDIITRAVTHMVDHLIVGVARNEGKGPMFIVEERVQMVRDEIDRLPSDIGKKIVVRSFDGLLMDFAKNVGATQVIRGLRAVSDFEYEFQMAAMNNRMTPTIETVFLMAGDRNQFIASKLVKEIARYGGDVTQFVPAGISAILYDRFGVTKAPSAQTKG